MTTSFGIHARPASMRWEDVRKGPPRNAVLDHLKSVVNYTAIRTGKHGR